jgi:hypothetical protein
MENENEDAYTPLAAGTAGEGHQQLPSSSQTAGRTDKATQSQLAAADERENAITPAPVSATTQQTSSSGCSIKCVGSCLWGSLKAPFFLIYALLSVVFCIFGGLWWLLTVPMRCGNEEHRNVNEVRSVIVWMIKSSIAFNY